MTTGHKELSFSELVFSDFSRYRPGENPGGVLLRVPAIPGLLASIILLAQQCMLRSGHVRLARSLRTLGNTLVGAVFGPDDIVRMCQFLTDLGTPTPPVRGLVIDGGLTS